MEERSLNILLVDDDVQVLSVHESLLRHMQHKVMSSMSPSEALEVIKNVHDIDMIITDFRMPEMDGAEFIERLRKITDVPVIVVTGYAEEAGLAGLHTQGITIMSKPVRYAALKNYISELPDTN